METLKVKSNIVELAGLPEVLISASGDLERYPDLIQYAKRFRTLGNDLHLPPLVVVMGAFNAGKSTLLNALLRQSLLNMHVLPATATVTMLRKGESGVIFGHSDNHPMRKWPLSRLSSLSAEGDLEAASVRDALAYLEVPLDIDFLDNVTLVDTPGLNSPNEAHTIATEEFAHRAHAVLWIVSCLYALNEHERSWIEQLPADVRVMVVVNQIDQLDPEDNSLPRIFQRIKNNLVRPGLFVIAVSAKLALEGILQGDVDLLSESKWPEFRSAFEDFILPIDPQRQQSRTAADLVCLIDPLTSEIARSLSIAEELRIKAEDGTRYNQDLAQRIDALTQAELALFNAPDAIDAVVNLAVGREWSVPESLNSKQEVLSGAICDLASEQSSIDDDASSIKARILKWEEDCAQWKTEREAYITSGLFGGEPILFKGERTKLEGRKSRLEVRSQVLNSSANQVSTRQRAHSEQRNRLERDCRGLLDEILVAIRATMNLLVKESHNIVNEQQIAATRLQELVWVPRFALSVRQQRHWDLRQQIGTWSEDADSALSLVLDQFDKTIDLASNLICNVVVDQPLVEPKGLERPEASDGPRFKVHVASGSAKTIGIAVAVLVTFIALLFLFVQNHSRQPSSLSVSETQQVVPSLVAVKQTPADDIVLITTELNSQSLVPDGAMIDIPTSAPGVSLHVQRVSCGDLQPPCSKLFIFSGTRAVWGNDLDPSATYSSPVVDGLGAFHIEQTEPGTDSQPIIEAAHYFWDGSTITRRLYGASQPNDAQPTVDIPSAVVADADAKDSTPIGNSTVQIGQALRTWVIAMGSNDPERISACYADHVYRYFLQRDWDQKAIQNYLTQWFKGGTKRIDSFEITPILVTMESETSSTVSLVKHQRITDSSGTIELVNRSELHLQKQQDGMWKISSERDFR